MSYFLNIKNNGFISFKICSLNTFTQTLVLFAITPNPRPWSEVWKWNCTGMLIYLVMAGHKWKFVYSDYHEYIFSWPFCPSFQRMPVILDLMGKTLGMHLEKRFCMAILDRLALYFQSRLLSGRNGVKVIRENVNYSFKPKLSTMIAFV